MNYKKHYDLLIARGKRTIIHGYFERHHITPKCMGGTDDSENIVELTAREHYVAHQLLAKIYPNNRKILYALQAMLRCGPGQQRSNRRYDWVRKAISNARKGSTPWNKGVPMSQETKDKVSKSRSGISPWNKGIPGRAQGAGVEFHTEETKQLMSEKAKERSKTCPPPHNEEWSRKVSAAKKGKPLSEAHKAALKEAWKKRKLI